jgi:putative transposase
MGKPYSVDLRERVVAAVEEAGLSRRQAAARFGVSYSAAIAWVKRHRQGVTFSGTERPLAR